LAAAELADETLLSSATRADLAATAEFLDREMHASVAEAAGRNAFELAEYLLAAALAAPETPGH
jgi:hypothetical protein